MVIFSRFIRHICIVISWLVVSLSVQAEVDLEVTKNSRLIEQVQRDAPFYTLPISAMRKVNGVIAAEYNMQLSGSINSYTWEVLPGLSAKVVYEKALQELQMADAQIMYQCYGRTCGSSNQWANQVFKQSRLYGLDSQQSYAALKQIGKTGLNYYAVYSTQRGNKKVYFHLEMIQE